MGADLHDAFGAARGFDHQPALADVVRAGLLDIHVLAGIAGEEGGGRVPVVRHSDEDGVHGFVLKDAAQVADGLGRFSPGVGDVFNSGGQAVLVHIAHVGEVHGVVLDEGLEMAGAHATGADEADGELAVRALSTHAAGKMQRGGGRRGERGVTQEGAAGDCGHEVNELSGGDG